MNGTIDVLLKKAVGEQCLKLLMTMLVTAVFSQHPGGKTCACRNIKSIVFL